MSDGIAKVSRRVYIRSPHEGVSAMLGVTYVGNGLRRMEVLTDQSKSDWPENFMVRYSEDNGKTWTQWSPLPERKKRQGDTLKEVLEFAFGYDPVSQRTIRAVFNRVYVGGGYHDHTSYQLSQDDGRTWSEPRMFRYEDGPEFDPNNWAAEEYLKSNCLYGGYNIIALKNGTILYPGCLRVQHINEKGQQESVTGVRCWIGRWNQQTQDYDWTVSEPVAVSLSISSRGLMEPYLAELQNGNILMEMRGSNTSTTPGRRWISVSRDGGHTWSEVTDLRYDDGEQFYAPSSMARILRSSRTGKLYWIGNICQQPPSGNSPRYPLYIAEIDENRVALKRDTLTVIDDRDPQRDSPLLQLSNFSAFENRQTKAIEIYLTRLGQRGGAQFGPEFWTADVYRYVLRLKRAPKRGDS